VLERLDGATALVSRRLGLVVLLESEFHLSRVAVIALLAHWLQVNLGGLGVKTHAIKRAWVL